MYRPSSAEGHQTSVLAVTSKGCQMYHLNTLQLKLSNESPLINLIVSNDRLLSYPNELHPRPNKFVVISRPDVSHMHAMFMVIGEHKLCSCTLKF